jgi:PAS domain S-box-containing protein
MDMDFSLEDVVRFANDIVIITEAFPLDEPGPKIVYVNKAFTRLTGYTREEVLGKSLRILQEPESDSDKKAKIRAALEKREPVRTTIVNYSKSGKAYWLDINIIPLKNKRGEVTHFAAIERDLTEIKEAEKEIKAKNQELLELNDTKNRFLGIASHDLRNPLYLIRSFCEILKDEGVGGINAKQKELLEKIYSSSNYMRSLVDNLLDISKIESGKIELEMKAQDFNCLVKTQCELNQLLANKKNIQLHLRLKEIPQILFDENAIVQAMDNFIENAIKFSPSNSHVYILTEKMPEHIQFSVKDEGQGLSQEDQKLLFGEFQKLSAKPTGGEKSTGLGLAIVKKIINLHGGEVGVKSKLGEGSTFYFRLPISQTK